MKPKSHESKSSDMTAGNGSEGPPLFSHSILVEQVPETGWDVAIEADAGERAALAAANGLVSIAKLTAAFRVTHRPGKRINVGGQVQATIAQICVVSLEPFEAEITEEVDVDFMWPQDLAKAQLEQAASQDRGKPEEEEEDLPDEIIDGKIDLGALASEFLALALDPYPRKPGVQFEDVLSDPQDDKDSPFAVLRKLTDTP